MQVNTHFVENVKGTSAKNGRDSRPGHKSTQFCNILLGVDPFIDGTDELSGRRKQCLYDTEEVVILSGQNGDVDLSRRRIPG